MIDIFRMCRERVSAQDAAQHYGITFDRRGWTCCPFHDDRHPSMSFKNGRFRCWACNASGDAIDFVARLLGLEPLEAVRRLNDDFRLGLPVDRPQTAQEAQRRRDLSATHLAYQEWKTDLVRQLNDCFREGHFALKNCQTLDDLTEAESLAVRWQPVIEHWVDCLTSDDLSMQMGVFRDREEVEQLCNMILKSMPTKSGAA